MLLNWYLSNCNKAIYKNLKHKSLFLFLSVNVHYPKNDWSGFVHPKNWLVRICPSSKKWLVRICPSSKKWLVRNCPSSKKWLVRICYHAYKSSWYKITNGLKCRSLWRYIYKKVYLFQFLKYKLKDKIS